jgi:hypothetical protein
MSSRAIVVFLAGLAILCTIVIALIPSTPETKRLHGHGQGGRMGDYLRSQEGGRG